MARPEHLSMLDRGAEAWNKWRQSEQADYPDLTGADLSDRDLVGYDFTNAYLDRTKFTRAKLAKAILRHAEAAGADFSDADLRRGVLSRANLEGSTFARADLVATNFTGANLYGVDLSSADLRGATGILLDGCRIKDAHFPALSDDPWSVLRRSYTGSRMLIHLLALVIFVVPLFVKTGFWVGVNRGQQLLAGMLKRVEQAVVSRRSPEEHRTNLLADALKQVSESGLCLRAECREVPVWKLSIGMEQEFHLAILALAFLVYNGFRGVLTFVVSALRDEEVRSGYAPEFSYRFESKVKVPGLGIAQLLGTLSRLSSYYGWLIVPHRFLRTFWWIALASFAWHLWNWSRVVVFVPA